MNRRLWMAKATVPRKPNSAFKEKSVGHLDVTLLAELMDKPNAGMIDHEEA